MWYNSFLWKIPNKAVSAVYSDYWPCVHEWILLYGRLTCFYTAGTIWSLLNWMKKIYHEKEEESSYLKKILLRKRLGLSQSGCCDKREWQKKFPNLIYYHSYPSVIKKRTTSNTLSNVAILSWSLVQLLLKLGKG